MSATTVEEPRPRTASTDPARRWIISPLVDTSLILFTPLVAVPAVLLAASPSVGVKTATISLFVAAFFALGHHLPGLMRAYGDRELFERFKLRFLLAPPLVLLAYFPLYNYHPGLYRLIILVWATWHGFMQLYGFVRIYDAKVGSTARATANWDWLVCLFGFATARLFGPEQVSNNLSNWYSIGGTAISPQTVNALRWTALGLCAFVLIGFFVNYAIQWYRGPKPNPLKLAMLASGIGTWWFAMTMIDELILGVALFDICHDVQYLAIVWLYNCRRVGSNAEFGSFMRYVFRRGMVLLYLGLIAGYGAVGWFAPLVKDGTISNVLYGVLFTSTILHYYYDGFIWKVREPSTRASLGLEDGPVRAIDRWRSDGRLVHAVKWGAVSVALGLLFLTDFLNPPLTTARMEELEKTYTRTLVGKPTLPENEEEQSWLMNKFEASLNIAAAVPDDRKAQLRAAVMLANFGRNDEAEARLEEILRQHPDYRDAHVALADIHFYRGNLDPAFDHYQQALALSRDGRERSPVNFKLGEIALLRNDEAEARTRFRAAERDDDRLGAAVKELKRPGAAAAYP